MIIFIFIDGIIFFIIEVLDGVVMAAALHRIAPDFFTDSWVGKIKPDAGANWRLKVSNLKKIVERVIG